MLVNELCAVKALLNGAWTAKAYLARIVECEEDGNDNWTISRIRIVGEKEDRCIDTDKAVIGYSRINPADMQDAAERLIGRQWGQLKAYDDYEALKASILEA